MRTSVRNAISGTALLAVGLGVGLAGGWAAGSTGGGSAGLPPIQSSPRGADTPPAATPAFSGRLFSYNSCDALLDALRARGRALVGPYGFSNSGGGIAYGNSTD